MVDLSKLFKNAVMNLYKSNVYTVDYAIIEASKLADKNKINAKDYEELITYLAEEQEKSMQEVEETTEDIKAAPEEASEETLTIDDIKEGDIIKVTYDKDNNVTRIEVMSTPEEKLGDTEEKASEQEEGSEEETTETATEETTES